MGRVYNRPVSDLQFQFSERRMTHALPILNTNLPGDRPPAPPAAPADARRGGQLVDSYGRTIHDLRLSITDRCNFRCVYCMDPDFRYMPKRELLDLDEFVALVRSCLPLGIRKLRLTGGEPTLYPRLDELIRELGRMPLDDVALTTNGSMMDRSRANTWKQLGLRRITFSLDTVDRQKMRQITRSRTALETVVRAIDAAHQAGLGPVKVNCVVIRGVNEDGVADMAAFARRHDVDMRFIEFMPLDSSHAWNRSHVVSAAEVLERIGERFALEPIDEGDPHSTSMNYRFADGGPGRIGVVAPVTRTFCGACSRLRITADGKIRPCLFSHEEWDIRPLLRSGADDDALRDYIIDAVWTKQAGHGINSKDFVQPQRTMSAIGG